MALPAWAAVGMAGLGAAGNIGAAILGRNAQRDAINQANAENAASLRQQLGISEQQQELARPLLNVRDGVLGVLAQQFGIAPPTPSLVRSEADGTALVPVPGVTYRDRASGAPDARSPVFIDPVNQTFTTQSGAVLAPIRDGRLPNFTQGTDNAVEVRNGQIVGIGNRGQGTIMSVPDQVERPGPVDSRGQPIQQSPQTLSLADFAGPQQNVMGADLRGFSGPSQQVSGVQLNRFDGPAQRVAGTQLNAFNAPEQTVRSVSLQNLNAPGQNVNSISLGDFTGQRSRVGEDLFGRARELRGDSAVNPLLIELQGMTGQDQLEFERAEAERALSRLANARGLRNSGGELAALRERDANIVGMRQDQRINNALNVAALTGAREDAEFGQTSNLANFLGLRDDTRFGQEFSQTQANNANRLTEGNFAAGREDQLFNRAVTANQIANQNALTSANFAAGREDNAFNRALQGNQAQNQNILAQDTFNASRDDNAFNRSLAGIQQNNQSLLSQGAFNAGRDDNAFNRALAGNQTNNQTALSLANFAAGREDQLFNRGLQENQIANQNALLSAQFGANRADQEIANLFNLAGLGNSGTAPAFNAGLGAQGAFGNAGNLGAQLALQGGNANANMYGGIANGLSQGLFDFAMLGGFGGGGGQGQSVNNISSQNWRMGNF